MSRTRTSLLLRASAVLLVAAPVVAPAQTLVREAAADSAAGVPRGMMPPVGKCRVWMDGVPANRQPAPTDCATALRQKPRNARVIYGPNAADPREAGLDAAAERKRSLLTPIGQRRPPLVQEDARVPARAPARGRAQPTVRKPVPPKPAPAPRDTKPVPPKKPERP